MTRKINLDNLEQSDGPTIEYFLETPISSREWKPAIQHPRIAKNAIHGAKSVGIRSVLPSDDKTNTFTTHWTRSLFCNMQKVLICTLNFQIER